MNQSDPVDRAVQYFDEGFVCSQSVLMAYAPQLGLDVAAAARLAAPFGAGIGRLGNMCGAVSGALMVIGARYGHAAADDEVAKERAYEIARKLIDQFTKRQGSLVCRELLDCDLSIPHEMERARAEGLFETKCPEFVRAAAQIVAALLRDMSDR